MQFATSFAALVVAAATVVTTLVNASPAPVASVISEEDFHNWLATTDANITYIGEPISRRSVNSGLTKRDNVMVTYCDRRTQDVCGGDCTVYNGGPACLAAPDTACLSATANVGFCDHGGCSGSCNQLSSCGTRLDNGFCFTPGTSSIIVPAV